MVKLDEDNFLFWKHQVLAALRGCGLESFLDENSTIPPETTTLNNSSSELVDPVPEHQYWKRQDNLIIYWPLGSMSNDLLSETLHCTYSCEVLKVLNARFQAKFFVSSYSTALSVYNKCHTSSLWHNRLGHPNPRIVHHVLKTCNISFSNKESLRHACAVRKSHNLPFHDSLTQYTSPVQLIVADVWGSSYEVSRNECVIILASLMHIHAYMGVFS